MLHQVTSCKLSKPRGACGINPRPCHEGVIRSSTLWLLPVTLLYLPVNKVSAFITSSDHCTECATFVPSSDFSSGGSRERLLSYCVMVPPVDCHCLHGDSHVHGHHCCVISRRVIMTLQPQLAPSWNKQLNAPGELCATSQATAPVPLNVSDAHPRFGCSHQCFRIALETHPPGTL